MKMEAKLKNEIDFEIRKTLTNGICLSGANISHMKDLLKKKYVSKKEMRKALETQMEYLEMIEKSKNVLSKLNCEHDFYIDISCVETKLLDNDLPWFPTRGKEPYGA